MKRTIIGLLALCLVIAQAAVTTAEICSFFNKTHNNQALGDTFYRPISCSQISINKYWSDFNFDWGDWDNGFGAEDACNIDLPLNRTFNALWALQFTSPDRATSLSDFSGNILRWGYNYAAREIDELDGVCGPNPPQYFAGTYTGIFVDNRTVLAMPFFYWQGVPERAATLVHEARHADGVGHGSCQCPADISCDTRFGDQGANTYEVTYLARFVRDGINTTSAMKRRAQDGGNVTLQDHFCTPTSYRLNFPIP